MPRIIPRSEWGARYGDGKHWRNLPATEAWLHHSVTIAPDLVPPWTDDDQAIRAIEQIGHDRFGWNYGFPYTWGVTPVGRIYAGHHVGKTGAHTAGHNRIGVGICLVGNYEQDQPTGAQLNAVAWLLQEAHQQGWLAHPRLTGGHRQVYSTACPGIHAYNQIDRINQLAAGAAIQEEDDMPSPKEWDEADKKAIYEATWFGAAGASLIRNRMAGGADGWPESYLGSAEDRIIRQNLQPMRAEVLKAIRDSANGQPVEVDEQTIVDGVLAGLTPDKIAEAIPDDIASQVVDQLSARLNQGGQS